MRDIARQVIGNARRSGDRIGVDGEQHEPNRLAADSIRLARLATSIHLTQAAGLMAAVSTEVDRTSLAREIAQ